MLENIVRARATAHVEIGFGESNSLYTNIGSFQNAAGKSKTRSAARAKKGDPARYVPEVL